MRVDQQYFKGYTLTEKPIVAQESLTTNLGNFTLTYSNDLKITEYKGQEQMIMIGYAILGNDISLSEKDILAQLDSLNQQERHLYLNKLNGRYALLIAGPEPIVYPDATTMRPVFYHESFPIIASHSGLVAQAAQQLYNESPVKYAGSMNGFLDYSKFKDVYKLNCNNYLAVGPQRTTRFYPSVPFKERSVDEVLSKTIHYFTNVREWIRQQDIYLTVTAGTDSRLSLAVIHDKTCPLLTYDRLGKLTGFGKIAYQNDVRIVKTMIDDLDLNHSFLHIDINANIAEETKQYSSQFESNHSYSLSEVLNKSHFKGKLHVKSTIFELAKLPVKPKYYSLEDFDFFDIILKKKPIALKAESNEKMIVDYLERVNLNSESMMGYHFVDIYYQEQRMGNWHSNITQETDNSVEVFVFLNTREMINLVTSVPLLLRDNKTMHREWINHFWPVLNFYPINTEKNLYELYKTVTLQVKMSGEEVQVSGHTVKPKWPITQPEVHFSVTNESDQDRVVSVKGHYNNPNGIGLLKLRIGEEVYNYHDLVNGHTLNLQPKEVVNMTIIYNKLYERESWQKAARLTIK